VLLAIVAMPVKTVGRLGALGAPRIIRRVLQRAHIQNIRQKAERMIAFQAAIIFKKYHHPAFITEKTFHIV
jgi:hypothetical protein